MKEQYYEPELGQMMFGQQWQELSCPNNVKSILFELEDWFEHHAPWNKQGTPFSNTGQRFKNDVFECNAYDWNEDNEQPYNFKWNDIEVSWYKHLRRGTTINRIPTLEEIEQMRSECLKSLK